MRSILRKVERGSASKGSYHQVWWPECLPWDPQSEERMDFCKLTLTSTHAWCTQKALSVGSLHRPFWSFIFTQVLIWVSGTRMRKGVRYPFLFFFFFVCVLILRRLFVNWKCSWKLDSSGLRPTPHPRNYRKSHRCVMSYFVISQISRLSTF